MSRDMNSTSRGSLTSFLCTCTCTSTCTPSARLSASERKQVCVTVIETHISTSFQAPFLLHLFIPTPIQITHLLQPNPSSPIQHPHHTHPHHASRRPRHHLQQRGEQQDQRVDEQAGRQEDWRDERRDGSCLFSPSPLSIRNRESFNRLGTDMRVYLYLDVRENRASGEDESHCAGRRCDYGPQPGEVSLDRWQSTTARGLIGVD